MRFEFDGLEELGRQAKAWRQPEGSAGDLRPDVLGRPGIDDPEQFRAIGWCRGRICSAIFEVRHDEEGEYYHLVTAWKATREEEQSHAENA